MEILRLHGGENTIHESGLEEFGGGDLFAEKEGLVGFGDAEARDEGGGGAAFGGETEGGERCKEVGGLEAVDEVGVGDESGRETNCGAVERGDEDLGVLVEGAGDIEVVGCDWAVLGRERGKG